MCGLSNGSEERSCTWPSLFGRIPTTWTNKKRTRRQRDRPTRQQRANESVGILLLFNLRENSAPQNLPCCGEQWRKLPAVYLHGDSRRRPSLCADGVVRLDAVWCCRPSRNKSELRQQGGMRHGNELSRQRSTSTSIRVAVHTTSGQYLLALLLFFFRIKLQVNYLVHDTGPSPGGLTLPCRERSCKMRRSRSPGRSAAQFP